MPHVDEQLRVEFGDSTALHLRVWVYIIKRTARLDCMIQVERMSDGRHVWWGAGPDSKAIWNCFDLEIKSGDAAEFKFAGPDSRAALEEVKYVLSHKPPLMDDKIPDIIARREGCIPLTAPYHDRVRQLVERQTQDGHDLTAELAEYHASLNSGVEDVPLSFDETQRFREAQRTLGRTGIGYVAATGGSSG